MSLPGLLLYLHPDEKYPPTWYDDERKEGITHPCFVATGEHRIKNGRLLRCEEYQFYFKQNLAIGLFGLFEKSKPLRYHRHDVEAILVLFDDNTREPLWVYYKAHGAGQGVWIEWEKCQKTDNGALVVYIAWGSHATYPRPCNVTRIFGFANDSVSNKGAQISIPQSAFVKAEDVKFGKGIEIHDTVQLVSNYSVTEIERLFLPITNKEIKKKARKVGGH